MKVAVLGYGLIGRERVAAVVRLREESQGLTGLAVHDPFAVADASEGRGARWKMV